MNLTRITRLLKFSQALQAGNGQNAEGTWHKAQRLEFREDGSLDVHASVSGLNEIVWWILG